MNDPEPLRCDEISLRLPDLLSGELADADARAIASHVERCARCAREHADLAALERLFERDATPAPLDVAEARLALRRALARERGAAPAPALGGARIVLRELRLAAGFALLLALFVPVFPRLQRALAPPAADGAPLSIANRAQELVASVGAWLPPLPDWTLPPDWSLPTAPPEALRSWFGALHSDAH